MNRATVNRPAMAGVWTASFTFSCCQHDRAGVIFECGAPAGVVPKVDEGLLLQIGRWPKICPLTIKPCVPELLVGGRGSAFDQKKSCDGAPHDVESTGSPVSVPPSGEAGLRQKNLFYSPGVFVMLAFFLGCREFHAHRSILSTISLERNMPLGLTSYRLRCPPFSPPPSILVSLCMLAGIRRVPDGNPGIPTVQSC
jgi:hypothetical protein